MSALACIEVLVPGVRGGMEDKEHIGKMVVYLSAMLQALATRLLAMAILTDGRHAALYVARKADDGMVTFARSKSFALEAGKSQHIPKLADCAGVFSCCISLHAIACWFT